jgi:hypothetical protein
MYTYIWSTFLPPLLIWGVIDILNTKLCHLNVFKNYISLIVNGVLNFYELMWY